MLSSNIFINVVVLFWTSIHRNWNSGTSYDCVPPSHRPYALTYLKDSFTATDHTYICDKPMWLYLCIRVWSTTVTGTLHPIQGSFWTSGPNYWNRKAAVQLSFRNYSLLKYSYISMPIDHQSTSKLWPLCLMISGAKYSGVPTKEFVNYKGINLPKSLQKYFDNPKSVTCT